MMQLLRIVAIGVGATLCIDVWSLLLRRVLGVRSLDYCLLGRWLLHMPAGTFMHRDIAASARRRGECGLGWIVHYSIGVAFAMVFVLLVTDEWITRPRLVTALAFGAATVAIPFLTIQPAFGLGIASSRAASPVAARLKSVATHVVFGLGLYLTTALLERAF